MSRLSELATELVSAHASTTPMTKEELIQELQDVYKTLLQLETQGSVEAEEEQLQPAEALTITKRKAFGKDKIYCMICGKPFTTLKRHLAVAHEMKPGAYRKKFSIPTSTPLTSKNYSESRKQMALDKDLGAGLAKARAARKKQA